MTLDRIEPAPSLARGALAALVDVALAVLLWAALSAIVFGALGLAAAAFLGFAEVARRAGDFFGLDPASAFDNPAFHIVSILLYATLIGAALAVARIRARARWREWVAWRPFRADARYWALVAAAVVYGLGTGALIEKIYPQSREWFVFPHAPLSVALSFILVVVGAPLAEELAFRGLLFGDLRPRYGFAMALVVSATLFALAHWESTHLYAAAVLPLGLLLGYVRERANSVRASALLHAIYNLSGWLAAALAASAAS